MMMLPAFVLLLSLPYASLPCTAGNSYSTKVFHKKFFLKRNSKKEKYD